MIETLEAVGVAATAIDLVADKFMDAATVSWGDLHTAGVTGRDIVRARRHLAGPPVAAPPAAGTATSPDSVVAASVEGAVSSAPSAIAVAATGASAAVTTHPSVEPAPTGVVEPATGPVLVASTSSLSASHPAQVRGTTSAITHLQRRNVFVSREMSHERGKVYACKWRGGEGQREASAFCSDRSDRAVWLPPRLDCYG